MFLPTALKLVLRRDATKRSLDYHRLSSELLAGAGPDTGMRCIGLYPEGDEDLAEAQALLVQALTRELPAGGHWLDLGCGEGGAAELALERDPELRITAVDVAPRAVEKARVRLARFGERARVLVADGDRLPFVRESFDGVYALNSARQARERDQLAHQVWTCLEPGGAFAVSDFAAKPEQLRLYDAGVVAAARLLLGCGELTSAESWRATCERRGFRDVEVEDLSEAVLPGLERQAELLEEAAHGVGLGRLAVASAARGMRYLARRGTSGPLAYLLIRAVKD